MKALVLGGGSMKGAFQVGAIQAVLESGFKPDMIYGISVGALNSTFLVHEASRQLDQQQSIDWEIVGRRLLEFWVTNITQPQDVSVLRSRVSLGVDTLMSRFNGLLDPSPLRRLINQQIDLPTLVKSPIKFKVGAVNITSGDMVYASQSDPNILDYITASAALPALMPPVIIGDSVFQDGGLRELVPVRQAMKDGATDIMLLACHSAQVFNGEAFNPRNVISLMERVRNITVNQLENNDIDWAESFAERSNLKGNPINVTVIRPNTPLQLDLQRFTSGDISRLMGEGYRVGLETLKKGSAPLV
jgi:NTE family protein